MLLIDDTLHFFHLQREAFTQTLKCLLFGFFCRGYPFFAGLPITNSYTPKVLAIFSSRYGRVIMNNEKGEKNGGKSTQYRDTLEGLRTYEELAAYACFGVWMGLPLRWARPDMRQVLPYWLTVRERTSPQALNRNARYAVDPANVCLN